MRSLFLGCCLAFLFWGFCRFMRWLIVDAWPLNQDSYPEPKWKPRPMVRVVMFDPGDLVMEDVPSKVEATSYRGVRVMEPRTGEVLGEANPTGPSFMVRWDDGVTEEVPATRLRRSWDD